MNVRIFFFLLLFFFLPKIISSQSKSPVEFFGSDHDNMVTPHHEMVNYFKYLELSSDRVQYVEYGKTYQGRPLFVVFISKSENLEKLSTIRETQMYLSGISKEKPAELKEKVLVWITANTHGNEFSAMESAIQTAWHLSHSDEASLNQWLEEMVVIIDPCANPDGTARYANWLRDIAGNKLNPEVFDREHMEPWPGGRYNHYLFDLNRDWAWQIQRESQYRVALYSKWMPHVHVDVHEMGYNSPYYFPPAAKPYHPYITQYQKDFQSLIGKNNAKVFDQQNWAYYTSEWFDLYYPSYGDTWPTYNGAIGMTYEKGGINAGRAVEMSNGDILYLSDRVAQQTAAILSAISTASQNKTELVDNFKKYFSNYSKNPPGKYKTYIIKNGKRSRELADLLQKNNIPCNYANEELTIEAYHYQTDEIRKVNVEKGDIIIYADQPRAVMTQMLLEPKHALEDSMSYDITSWPMPLAFGVESYASEKKINIATQNSAITIHKTNCTDLPYAWVIEWGDMQAASFLAQLSEDGIRARVSRETAKFGDVQINIGDIIVNRFDNRNHPHLREIMEDGIDRKVAIHCLKTGKSTEGPDLGGNMYPLVRIPKVLTFSGRGISANDFGEIWFFFDQIMSYPLSKVNKEDFSRINLNHFNTLIIPSNYSAFSDVEIEKISQWVSAGGRLILSGNAVNAFVDKPGFDLKRAEAQEGNSDKKEESEDERLIAYSELERRNLSQSVRGSVFENHADMTNPIAFGLGDKYYHIKTNPQKYELLKNGLNPVYIPDGYRYFGFVGSKKKDTYGKSLSVGVQNSGRGEIVYFVDNPLFRMFWETGKILFSNAVFFPF
jgi:hypothetical protein